MTWPDLIQNALTVGAGLGGTVVGTWLANRASRSARVDARRDAAVDAVAELVEYLDRHRANMWTQVARRLASAANIIPSDPSAANADTDASHASRAAITRPRTMLCLRVRALAPHVRTAERAVYAMRRASRLTDLERRRAAAIRACEDLVDAASGILDTAVIRKSP